MKTVLFGHLETFEVKVGDVVKQGDKIGLMGNTGHSNGVHLHMTVADTEQNDIWWLADSPSVKCSKASTDAYLAGGRAFKDSKGWQDKEYTTGWLGYENHYAYDLVSANAEIPYVVWSPKEFGKVVCVRDDGNCRYGKVVLVQYPYAPPKAKTTRTHTVKAGESWWSIAHDKLGNGSKCNELAKFNGTTIDAVIHAGTTINLPCEEEEVYTVKRGDSWWSIAKDKLGDGSRYRELALFNGTDASKVIHTGDVLRLPK